MYSIVVSLVLLFTLQGKDCSVGKLPRPTPSLTRCARSVLEGGAFSREDFAGCCPFPMQGVARDTTTVRAEGTVLCARSYSRRGLSRRGPLSSQPTLILGGLTRFALPTRGVGAARSPSPEFRTGLRRPLHRVRFGPDPVSCVTVPWTKNVAKAFPPRPTRSVRSLVEAWGSALPFADATAVSMARRSSATAPPVPPRPPARPSGTTGPFAGSTSPKIRNCGNIHHMVPSLKTKFYQYRRP